MDLTLRSFMNWEDLKDPESYESKVLSHWQKVGKFRNKHLAVGAGKHFEILDFPYTFARNYDKDGIVDKVICVIGALETENVDVSKVFSDGMKLRNAYTGEIATVKDGKVTFTAGIERLILIEEYI